MTASSSSPDTLPSRWPLRGAVSILGARGRGAAILALCTMASLQAVGGDTVLQDLRLATFDAYQRAFPRLRSSAPVVIVAIDEASLVRHGQWPWPRHLLARLVSNVVDAR